MPIELNPPYWTGGPPYPRFATDEGKFGLSILDWFAGHAVAGLMGSALIDRDFFDQFVFPEEQLPSQKSSSKVLLSEESPELLPENPTAKPTEYPPTPEQLAMIAYAIAGQMAEIRKRLPIEPKPIPTIPEEESNIPIVMPPSEMETVVGTVTVGSVPSPNTFVTLGNSNAPQEIPKTP